jgi:putative ABC transport system ATP-binding protein
MTLIELSDVTKQYGDGPAALDGLTLQVHAGEAVAVLGPSGSGKSTLLNLVAGLDRPSRGTVTVDGVRVDRLNEAASARYRRARIGIVFQFFNLLEDLTVLDNVLLPAQLAGMARPRARDRAHELLSYLGVDRHARAFPGRLSGGERQRVAVARALMNEPALLLADEPTGNLDPHTADHVFKALMQLVKATQVAMLIATHNMELAGRMDRRVSLVDGQVVEME